MLDYVLTDGSPYVVAGITVLFVYLLARQVRREWRAAGSMDERRLMAVTDYSYKRDIPIYVPPEWTREPRA